MTENKDNSSVDVEDPHDGIEIADISRRMTTIAQKENGVQYEGYLVKQGGNYKSWKRRYFTLTHDIIGYYDKKDGKLKGGILIEFISDVKDIVDPKFKNAGFAIVTASRTFVIQAESPQQKNVWMGKIRENVAAIAPASSDASAEVLIKSTGMSQHKPTVTGASERSLSLPKQVLAAGGIAAWNDRSGASAAQWRMIEAMCKADTVEGAMQEVDAIMGLGHQLWVYTYFRALYNRNVDLYYALLLSDPKKLMPVAYTPTVGEACQKFGSMPQYSRGCYVCLEDRGNFRAVLEDYAKAHLEPDPDGSGRYLCDCIVFSDGGRILGLGDLAAFGMGIPIGKLDLYTVCGGVDPRRTIPVILDVGCLDEGGNTAHLHIRDSPNYIGMKSDRVREKNNAGALVNSCYFGEGNVIEEFMTACTQVFGVNVLLQFEDFNSNDAFPLLEQYRHRFLTYNDDIQGTAAVTVAGMLGALKLKYPSETNLLSKIRNETILFFGSGSANLGAASLLHNAANVPKSHICMTGSRGLIWASDDGTVGTFRNNEQKEFAVKPEPSWSHKNLIDIVANVKPTMLVGAAGHAPGAFTQEVIEKMVEVNRDGDGLTGNHPSQRPVIFALSNPTSQAECTSEDAYTYSKGFAIYGSGTAMAPITYKNHIHHPGQVNNVYIFPAMSFAAVHCHAKEITDRLFLVAAQAVANSLSEQDLADDRVIPPIERIREVARNVATAVILACQEDGLAKNHIGDDWDAVYENVGMSMWTPGAPGTC